MNFYSYHTPTHKSTFFYYITRSPGQLGHRVAGFPGHWVAGSQNVTQFHVWPLPGMRCGLKHMATRAVRARPNPLCSVRDEADDFIQCVGRVVGSFNSCLIATRLAEMGSPGMANPGVLQLPCDREFAPLDISPPPRQLLTPDIAITYICLLVIWFCYMFYGSGLVFRVRVGLLSRAMRYAISQLIPPQETKS